jgi:glutathione peroxidase-family protein
MSDSIYEFKAKKNDGAELDFSLFAGKPLLIVNTASKCGFTSQYEGLEALHKKYGPRGLVVLAFPCDQFAHQEPGSSEEIASFCKRNYGVSFQIMEKVEVNGKNAHPVFAFLKKSAPASLGTSIKWNFTKFLIAKDGVSVTRYASAAVPESLEADIEKALKNEPA